ncbi:uncharacterized protein METZ01_LOCUS229360, partial [marine metagenome]
MVDDGPQFADEMVNAGEFEDAEYLLARQIAEVIKLAEDAKIFVPIPDSARRYVERVFSEWLEDAASVSRARRDLPYIANRSEFQTGAVLDPDFEWSQGLTLEELNDLYEDLIEDDPEYLLSFPTLHAKGPLAAMM